MSIMAPDFPPFSGLFGLLRASLEIRVLPKSDDEQASREWFWGGGVKKKKSSNVSFVPPRGVLVAVCYVISMLLLKERLSLRSRILPIVFIHTSKCRPAAYVMYVICHA